MILEGVIFRDSYKFGRTTLYSLYDYFVFNESQFFKFSAIFIFFPQRSDLFRRLLQVNNVLVPSSKQQSCKMAHA